MEKLIRVPVKRIRILEIKSIVFLSMLLFIIPSCALPKQPKETKAEKAYFSDLRDAYKCDVEREIEPGILSKAQKKATGSYLLRLYNWTCDSLSSPTLESLSSSISQNLYCNVLNEDKKYNEFIIVFDCEYAQASYRTKTFSYPADSLACLNFQTGKK